MVFLLCSSVLYVVVYFFTFFCSYTKFWELSELSNIYFFFCQRISSDSILFNLNMCTRFSYSIRHKTSKQIVHSTSTDKSFLTRRKNTKNDISFDYLKSQHPLYETHYCIKHFLIIIKLINQLNNVSLLYSTN